MAASDSSGTTAKVKYSLSNYLQWEMFYDIINDTAKDHEIWEYVNPDATSENLRSLFLPLLQNLQLQSPRRAGS